MEWLLDGVEHFCFCLRQVAREIAQLLHAFVAQAAGIALRNGPRPMAIDDRDVIAAVAFSPDGTRLAAATYQGGVHVWNSATLARIGFFPSNQSLPYHFDATVVLEFGVTHGALRTD